MRKFFTLLTLTGLFLFLYSCEQKPPTQVEGNAELDVTVQWDSTCGMDSIWLPLPNATIVLSSEYGNYTYHSDATGAINISEIPSAVYQVSARAIHPFNPNILLVGTQKGVEVYSGKKVDCKIFTTAISAAGISINELYVGGPVNNFYFFYDQYIELYNNSDSVKYLDGMIVARLSGSDQCGPGCDWGDDGDIDGVTYIFKFPGKPGEKNYPFEPHTYKVLAQTAYDHTQTVSTSIDLSNADWEFYNQLSASDFDNPNVPNLYNIRMDRTVDFYISLTADVIIIADGRDTVWTDGIDIDTILDGVEYQSNGTRMKTLDPRVDRGWVKSPPKYGGKSMQRREPGEDTNDGTLDWLILEHPTPGYQ